MSKDRLDISDNTAISMPVRNMIVIMVRSQSVFGHTLVY